MILETQNLILRELEERDTQALVHGLDNINVAKFLVTPPFPYTNSDAEWFIKKTLNDSKQIPRISYELAIAQKERDTLIGAIMLKDIDYTTLTCELGYWLSEEYWKKGITSQAANMAIKFAFEELHLNKIMAKAITQNIASNNLIKKLGFTFERMIPNAITQKYSGKIFDDNTYWLKREDWEKNKLKTTQE